MNDSQDRPWRSIYPTGCGLPSDTPRSIVATLAAAPFVFAALALIWVVDQIAWRFSQVRESGARMPKRAVLWHRIRMFGTVFGFGRKKGPRRGPEFR